MEWFGVYGSAMTHGLVFVWQKYIGSGVLVASELQCCQQRLLLVSTRLSVVGVWSMWRSCFRAMGVDVIRLHTRSLWIDVQPEVPSV